MSVEELKKRAEEKQAEQKAAKAGLDPAGFSILEARLKKMEEELNRLKTRTSANEERLGQLDGATGTNGTNGRDAKAEKEEGAFFSLPLSALPLLSLLPRRRPRLEYHHSRVATELAHPRDARD
jgi:hypothetical protein